MGDQKTTILSSIFCGLGLRFLASMISRNQSKILQKVVVVVVVGGGVVVVVVVVVVVLDVVRLGAGVGVGVVVVVVVVVVVLLLLPAGFAFFFYFCSFSDVKNPSKMVPTRLRNRS